MITLLLLIPFVLAIRSLAYYCADRQMRRKAKELDRLLMFETE